MVTFRKLIGNINNGQQSSLEQWFETIVDIPLDKLSIEDLCRAIRQDLCVTQLLPRVLDVLTQDPLAGEYYDGEVIAAVATIKPEILKNNHNLYTQIKIIINQINCSEIDDELRNDILKINKIDKQ
ncbi:MULTISPECIES: contact-dependent growth inhibition system immunity protein [Enterobacterales]|uniref:contact-dependent growth inhibition system immunity protein n=1 Tax=Enterobacterales TaxID=91347 RepID=UPI002ED7EBF1